jgi:CsoR family transcriptional regulator, copper-sensing transcriptional repressor
MPSITTLPPEDRADFVARLKRIEGQARGIRSMIEDERECLDVMQQVSAVKSAVNSLSAEMLEAFALHCLRHPEAFPSPDAAVEQMVRAVVRSGR